MRDQIIVRNSVRCLGCDEEIVCGHRHDFKYCSCGNVAVDGGTAYQRRLFKDGALGLDTSIYAGQPATREHLLERSAMLTWIKADARPLDEAWTTAQLLDDWKIVPTRVPPASGDMIELEGTATDHPDFRDGQRIRTTPLLLMGYGKGWARTVTRFYRGTPAKKTLQ